MSKFKVVAKIRPFLEGETQDDALQSNGNILSLRDSRNAGQRILYREFAACYDSNTEQSGTADSLFESEVEPLLDGVLKGRYTTIICYGVTGSGKTTTLQGSEQQQGIVRRSVQALMQRQQRFQSNSTERHIYKLQVFEVYCDDVYDLLLSRSELRKSKLKVHEDSNGRTQISPLIHQKFYTFDEFDVAYRRVCSSRSAAETGFNRFSSRSHSIIRILVCRSDSRRESSNRVEALIGQIQFVDLAGSESSRGVKMDQKIKAGPESIMKRMKQRRDETNSINKSLSMLSRVIEELNKKSALIPYRDCTLTRVLKDALGANSLTTLICHIAPGSKWLTYTRATIEFASKAKSIKAIPNVEKQAIVKKRIDHLRSTDVEFNRAVEEEVARRLAEIASHRLHDANQPNPVQYDPVDIGSPHTKSEVKQKASVMLESTERREPINTDTPFEQKSVPEPMPVLDQEKFELPYTISRSTTPIAAEPMDLPIEGPPKGPIGDPILEPPLTETNRCDIPLLCREARKDAVQNMPSVTLRATKPVQANDATTADDEEQDQYRRRLKKGLKEKHEKYLCRDKKLDRGKFARACIIAGKMALDDRDDLELSIAMFEKAIRWYPENERLLEETLKLKKRFREQQGIPNTLAQPARSAGRGEKVTLGPFRSNRLANPQNSATTLNYARKEQKRRHFMDSDEEYPTFQDKSPAESRGGPSKRVEPSSKGKEKGKRRAVLQTAIAAFADPDIEEVGAVDETKKNLMMEEEVKPSPVKKNKGERKAKSKKRKSDNDGCSDLRNPRPAKKSRRPLF